MQLNESVLPLCYGSTISPLFLCALKFVCTRQDFPNKSLSEENDIFYKGYHHKEYHAACIY